MKEILSLFFILLIVPHLASAISITKDYFPDNKTVLLYNNNYPVARIQLIESSSTPTDFKEVFKFESFFNYTTNDLTDFKYGWSKLKGKYNIDNVDWFILKNTTILSEENDYIYKNVTETDKNGTSYNETIVFLNGSYIRYETLQEWKSFNLNGLFIEKNVPKYIKLIYHKKAELGDISLQTYPTFMGLNVPDLTWWNSSYHSVVFITLTDGYRPAVLTVNLTNSSGSNNGTHVFLGSNVVGGIGGVVPVLDNVTILNSYLNYSRNVLYINVTGNGTVGMYYNTTSIATRNGDLTFPNYDEFNGSSLNTSMWNTASTAPTFSNGRIYLNGQSEIDANKNITQTSNYPIIMEAQITQESDVQFVGFALSPSSGNCVGAVCAPNSYIGAGVYDSWQWSRDSVYSEDAYTFGDGTYVFNVIANRFTVFQNGNPSTKITNVPLNALHASIADYRALGGGIYVDWVYAYTKIIDSASWSVQITNVTALKTKSYGRII